MKIPFPVCFYNWPICVVESLGSIKSFVVIECDVIDINCICNWSAWLCVTPRILITKLLCAALFENKWNLMHLLCLSLPVTVISIVTPIAIISSSDCLISYWSLSVRKSESEGIVLLSCSVHISSAAEESLWYYWCWNSLEPKLYYYIIIIRFVMFRCFS